MIGLDTVFLGNTMTQYLWFILFIFVGVILSKILSFLSNAMFTTLAAKTKTKLDDIFFNIMKKPQPLMLIILIICFNLGLSTLNVSDFLKSLLGKATFIAYVFAISWFIIKFILGFIEEYLEVYASKTKSKYDDQLIPLLKTTSRVVVIIFATLVVLANFGYNINALVAGLGIGGLAVAMASKDILENLLSGIIIFSERPFELEDVVKVNGVLGSVKEIGIRSTKVQTFDGTMVVLPNNKISTQAIENISKRKARKETMTLGLVYDTSVVKLEKAKKLVADILNKNKDVDEIYYISFNKFNDSSLDINVIYWINQLDYGLYLNIKDKVNMDIKKAFEKEKIDFAYPTKTIYMKK